jgi:hypothetical protein
MSLFLYQGESEPQMPTKRWVRSVGAKKVRIGNGTAWRPVASESVEHLEKLTSSYTGAGADVHGPVQYTGSTTHLPGYEHDMNPLIESKPGVAIQMTPMQSPNPMPQHGGFQQGHVQQGYQYGQHHVAAQQ